MVEKMPPFIKQLARLAWTTRLECKCLSRGTDDVHCIFLSDDACSRVYPNEPMERDERKIAYYLPGSLDELAMERRPDGLNAIKNPTPQIGRDWHDRTTRTEQRRQGPCHPARDPDPDWPAARCCLPVLPLAAAGTPPQALTRWPWPVTATAAARSARQVHCLKACAACHGTRSIGATVDKTIFALNIYICIIRRYLEKRAGSCTGGCWYSISYMILMPNAKNRLQQMAEWVELWRRIVQLFHKFWCNLCTLIFNILHQR